MIPQASRTKTPRRPRRIAIFTHDTYGLGHVRRALHFIRGLADAAPDAALLLVTGSPVLRPLEGLPRNADWIKIPTVVKTGSEAGRPPHLPFPVQEVTALRGRLIREAILGFAPDVFLVDNFPLGSRGELLPLLKDLRDTPTRTLLGLRDIVDVPETVRADWERQGMLEVLDRWYDGILVYGMRDVLDVVESYAIPPPIAAKVRYCGYVAAPPLLAGSIAPADLGIATPFLLATGGGGGDGFPLLWSFIEALDHLPEIPALVLTGPLMSASDRTKLMARASRRPSIVIRDYVGDLRGFLVSADVVVSMCGYNTAVEIVAQKARALVVPRTWRYGEHGQGTDAGTEGEQLLRARALARHGWVDILEPEDLTPQRLAAAIAHARDARPTPSIPLDLGGVSAVVRELLTPSGSPGPEATHAL